MSDEQDQNSKDEDQQEAKPPTLLGWIVQLSSLALLAALILVIVLQIAKPNEPIQFTLDVVEDEIRQQNGQWLIPVDITNDGTGTARVVEMTVQAGGEETDVTIDMIGHDETVRYIVSSPSRVEEVSHEIVSYEAP